MNDETRNQFLDLAGVHIRSLLEAHMRGIEECANDDEKNVASVGMSLKVDFSPKAPACAINISYSSRTKDAAAFRCDDPEQLKLINKP